MGGWGEGLETFSEDTSTGRRLLPSGHHAVTTLRRPQPRDGGKWLGEGSRYESLGEPTKKL